MQTKTAKKRKSRNNKSKALKKKQLLRLAGKVKWEGNLKLMRTA